MPVDTAEVVQEGPGEGATAPADPAVEPRVWWWPYAVVVGVSLAVRGLLALAGNGFQRVQLEPASVMHLVEPDRLAANPLAAVWDVHTNPPLFNLWVGVVLRWSPLADAASFRLVFTAGAIVAAVALCQVLRALGCHWTIAAVVAALMFSKPSVMAFEYYVAQESFVVPLLYVTLWAVARYGRRPSVGRFGVVLALATTLTLTRAQLSPIWLLGLVGVVLVVRPPPVDRRRAVAVAALVPVLLVGGVMLKNQVRFGTFSLSSWMGMNLSRVAVVPLGPERTERLVDDGVLSEVALVGPFQAYDAYEPDVEPCETHYGTAVLDDPVKGDGTWYANPNFNAACYVPVYDQALRDSVAAIRHEPGTYVRTVGVNVVVFLSDTGEAGDGRAGSVRGGVASFLDGLHDLLDVPWTRTTSYPNAWTRDYDIMLTFALGCVVLVAAAARSVARRVRGAATGRDALVLVIAWTVASVSAVSVLMDAFESERFRLPLDPLVIGIVLAGAAETVRRAVATRRSRAVTPPT